MKKRILSIMLCLVMLVGLIPAAALAEETATTEISSIAAMITAPDIDKTPAATATLTPADGLVCAQVAWFKLANSEDPNSKTADWIAMNEDETFAIGYYYKVNIFVTKTEGFTFADSVSVSVNEKPCTVTDIAALNAKALTYVFEPLSDEPATTEINSIAAEITAPAIGETQATTAALTPADGLVCAQVAWFKLANSEDPNSKTADWIAMNEDETFAIGYYYKVNIFVTKTEGFTFADSVSVSVNEKPCTVTDIAALNAKALTYVFEPLAEPVPAYPTTDSISGLNEKLVAVICNNVPAGEKTGEYYGLLDGGFTYASAPTLVNGAYECTINLIPSAYCSQYSTDTGVVHTVNPNTDVSALTFTVRYDSETEKWVPSGEISTMCIWVTCDEHKLPAYPTTDNISGLREKLVAVICNNVPAGEKTGEYYGLLDGGFTYASAPTLVNGAYECTINLIPSAYCSQYSTDTGVVHTVNPNTDVSALTFTVRYDSETEKWVPSGEISTMCIWVTCDEHKLPAYPTTDNISGLREKLVAVICNNVPAGEKTGEYYGLLDGGFTYASAPTLVNGAYECTINLIPSAYCSQYSTDTGVVHTVNPNTDVSALTFTVRYDSETEKWIPCGEISTMGIWVTCDKHVVEYTVSFAANGGSGTMDSKTVEKGTEYTLPACGFTAPSGKVFKAWSVNDTEKSVGDKIVINADTTVTAVWKAMVVPYVPGHTHSYTKVVTEPTCTERGYTTYTCSCGYSYVDDYVNAKGHTEVVDPAVAATCEKTGLTEGKHCSVCNEVLVAQKETPKTEHKFSNGKCSVCGAADPNYVAPVVNPFKDVKKGDPFYDEILWAADKGIINGDGTGNYNPNDGITRAQIVMILWNAAGNKEASKPSGFADVKDGAWYAKAVAWAVENGITNGTDLGFEPDRVCTRAEIVTFLHRANNKPAPAAAASFTDLTQDWYKDAVAWAVENGITKGVGGNRFAPNDTCTRGQAAAFMYRLAQLAK